MINQGLALKQPYESQYNAYRRFLIANGKNSLSDIRNEFRQKFENLDSKVFFSLGPKINTFELFQIFDHYTQYGEHKLDQLNIVKHLPDNISNCPDCALNFFHSDLYQLPWLSLCPIHHKPLVLLCPSCNQSWPKLGEMKSRHCKTCGTSYSWAELKKSKGFHPDDSSFCKLEFLDNLIKEYETLTLGMLINLHAPDYFLDRHNSISFNHELFPSVMSEINPALASTFEEYGVKVRKFNLLTYPAKIKPVTSQTDPNIDYHHYAIQLKSKRAKGIRKSLELIIRNEIRNRFNIVDLSFPYGFYFGQKRYLEDVAYLPILAFNIWKDLVDGEGLICDVFSKNYTPYIPCLLETLIFDPNNILYIQYLGMEHDEYNVPKEMQTILYKHDLWQTFRYILKYLDTIRYLHNKNELSWSSLETEFKNKSDSVSQTDLFFAFILIDDKNIDFIYSEECDNFSLNDIATLM